MIVSETKPMEEIVELLEGYKKVFIVGCGDCASACRVGGIEDLPPIAEKLEEHGFEVTGWIVPAQSCMQPKTKLELKSVSHLIEESDIIISFSCGAGTQTLCSILAGKIVVPGTNTIFLATTKRAGDFVQQCSMCGDCVLGITGGLCPQTLCAKSLMNGPCSGSVDGKCETYREQDCVWHKIYETLKQRGKLENFQTKIYMKDFSRLRNQAVKKVVPKKINISSGGKK
ncbi:MAG: methylenetetrahydrofolate reductase C-terminal domain-containing protein [Oligoflexia bacterium]|nr:methylenetetrahydrofolate reductase C-terminal domain-containing protein [Oligoflexia bacterium]